MKADTSVLTDHGLEYYGGHTETLKTRESRKSISQDSPVNISPAMVHRVDEDGDYWLMGRIDDVINVSGHRIGTAEIESALVSHESVAEAATVGYPHEIKGEGIYVYVTLKEGYEPTPELKKILVGHVRHVIGPIASPDKIQFAPGLPKTRSGKIMRRILRKIARGDTDDLGDTSTLADPSVVNEILKGKQ